MCDSKSTLDATAYDRRMMSVISLRKSSMFIGQENANTRETHIVIKNQHFIEYFRLLQTSSEYEMHLSAKYTIYTILDNLHVLYYTILKH